MLPSEPLATKVYRPGTVSIAGRKEPDQETLWRWWGYGQNLKVTGATEAEQLKRLMALRKKQFYLKAEPHTGYYILVALYKGQSHETDH